jgi:hypothetical protein
MDAHSSILLLLSAAFGFCCGAALVAAIASRQFYRLAAELERDRILKTLNSHPTRHTHD